MNRAIVAFRGRGWIVPLLVLAAFGLGFLLRGGSGGHDHAGVAVSAPAVATPRHWTCAMHPQIILPSNDQKCPICFMDLIPVETGTDAGLGPASLALSETAASLAEITTVPVRREFVTRELRLVGKVSPDESRTRTITARVGGRLDRLFVDTTGQTVTVGMKLAAIYSPELYSAQVELQTAAQALREAEQQGTGIVGARANRHSVVERLRLWGMDEQQIRSLMEGGDPGEHMIVSSPVGGVVVERKAMQGDYVRTGSLLYTIADLSRVWVTLQAFESDLGLLREGQPVSLVTRAHPGRTFAGDILFIEPVLDERTRTVEVRVAVDNRAGLLKPGMLAAGTVAVTVDAHGNQVTDTDASAAPLVIPASAPLLTGSRAVVYVRSPAAGDPVFTGRSVVLGPRANDVYTVVSGLSAGELVVTRGNFKIDSALQIQAKTSMMNPAVTEPVEKPEPTAVGSMTTFVGDPCFRQSLDRVLRAYYPLQAALAADDDTAAAAAAVAVKAAVADLACDTRELPAHVRDEWDRLRSALAAAAESTRTAKQIASRRQAFEPLADSLWFALARFGTDSGEAVRRFHCPMAFDSDGAFWIQKGETTANPYYGDLMLRCGSQKDILAAGSSGGS